MLNFNIISHKELACTLNVKQKKSNNLFALIKLSTWVVFRISC